LGDTTIDAIVFAVTSAEHNGTRRNPLPLYQRAMALQEFSSDLNVPCFVYPINDVGFRPDFAKYVIRSIDHQSDGRFNVTPANGLLLCSTASVISMYEDLGFRTLPAERCGRNGDDTWDVLPWSLVEAIAEDPGWEKNPLFLEKVHPSSQRLWSTYRTGDKVSLLFHDSMIGADGDLTETRDYSEYVRQMDTIARLKYEETSPFIRPGRIGDIGCAVGSWIQQAANEDSLRESDFTGVEISRKLFEICKQRKANGDFANDYVFFARKNAVNGPVFPPNSMNTIHTSSLTHEIESYGGWEELQAFIRNRYRELLPGGVWINRDVVGPDGKDRIVYMELNREDGSEEEIQQRFTDRDELRDHLQQLSTYGRFLRFVSDFRKDMSEPIEFTEEAIDGRQLIRVRLGDACEFLSKKDYVDNWESEMHETFCFWDLREWKQAVEEAGFVVHTDSYAKANQWIIENRLEGKAKLFTKTDDGLSPLPWPVTGMLLLAEKPELDLYGGHETLEMH
jgi:SAM-dependent methyltransferase